MQIYGRYTDAPRPRLRWSGVLFQLGLVILIFCGLFLIGCGPSDAEINSFVHDYEAEVTGTDYIVQPPDRIEITSPNAPEVDGEVVRVNPDGKVTLKLIGDIKVAGLTPVEIARKLETNLRKYYQRPVVSVAVSERNSKRIYVFGEVSQPGPKVYTGRDTVLSVLGVAQPLFTAWANRTHVIRPSHEDGKRHVIIVNANDIMKRGELDNNFHLLEGDILYVPPTPLAYVGQKLSELFQPIQPAGMAVQTTGITLDSTERFQRNR